MNTVALENVDHEPMPARERAEDDHGRVDGDDDDALLVTRGEEKVGGGSNESNRDCDGMEDCSNGDATGEAAPCSWRQAEALRGLEEDVGDAVAKSKAEGDKTPEEGRAGCTDEQTDGETSEQPCLEQSSGPGMLQGKTSITRARVCRS